jgi:hypothetical protein
MGDGRGLAQFDGETWTVYTTEDSGLPSNQVTALAFDAQEILWIGTDNGLAQFDGVTWTVYTGKNSELPWGAAPALAFDAQGTLWVGMLSGGVVQFDGTTWTVYTTKNSKLPSNNVHKLTIDVQGNLWVGTQKGLATFDGETWTAYMPENSGLPGNWIWTLVSDTQGNIWMGTSNDGVAVYREGGVLFPEKATKIEDLVGIWKGWFKGSVVYWRFETDGTLTLSSDVKGLEDVLILSGTFWFEESLFKILESRKPGEIGTYEVHIRKKDGNAVHLSFRAIDDTGFWRPHDLGRGMTRVDP